MSDVGGVSRIRSDVISVQQRQPSHAYGLVQKDKFGSKATPEPPEETEGGQTERRIDLREDHGCRGSAVLE
jgi:hypothetical protein